MSVIYTTHFLLTIYSLSDMIVKSFLVFTTREGFSRQTNKMFITLDGYNSINKTETFCMVQRYR